MNKRDAEHDMVIVTKKLLIGGEGFGGEVFVLRDIARHWIERAVAAEKEVPEGNASEEVVKIKERLKREMEQGRAFTAQRNANVVAGLDHIVTSTNSPIRSRCASAAKALILEQAERIVGLLFDPECDTSVREFFELKLAEARRESDKLREQRADGVIANDRLKEENERLRKEKGEEVVGSGFASEVYRDLKEEIASMRGVIKDLRSIVKESFEEENS